MTPAEVLARLRATSLFQGLADVELEAFTAICEPVKLAPAHPILAEGEEGDSMFVLLRGRVRVERTTPAGDRYLVAELESGFFGELALLDRDRRSASVITQTDCELLSVRRERFLAFGDAHPAAGLTLTRRIAQQVCVRMRRANDDITALYAALLREIDERI